MARDTSFSYSFLVLPAEQRRAVGVVWDFCRAVDDSVDEEPDRGRARMKVAEWRAEVGRLFEGSAPSSPQGRQLQPVVREFSLSRESRNSLSAEIRFGGLSHSRRTVTYKVRSEAELLSTELAILGHDKLYEAAVEVAAQIGAVKQE